MQVWVSYSGSPPFFYNISVPRKIWIEDPHWQLLRYDLEQDCIETTQYPDVPRNRRTYLEGYSLVPHGSSMDLLQNQWKEDPTAKKSSLQNAEFLKKDSVLKPNDYILLVRKPMPLGARAYVPVLRNPAYLKLYEEFKSLQTKRSWNDLSNVRLLMHSDNALDAPKDSQQERRDKVAEWLKKMTIAAGNHASDLEQRVLTQETTVYDPLRMTLNHTSCQYEDVAVVPTYKCFDCMRLGHHHHDACFLYEKQVKELVPMWGAQKFSQKKLFEDI